MKESEQHLSWFLRVTAIMLLAAALAVVIPHAWMNAIHVWFGLGELPDLPMVAYLTRSLSTLYAVVGAWCWFVSRDVRRNLPLLRFSVPITFGFDATVIAIDVVVEMPLAWSALEGTFLLAWTLTLWRLVRRAANDA
jgi:hypothetical protein